MTRTTASLFVFLAGLSASAQAAPQGEFQVEFHRYSPSGYRVRGWACDPLQPAARLTVRLYVDSETSSHLIATTTANLQREAAIGTSCGSSSSDFGFEAALSGVPVDGHAHRLIARAALSSPGTSARLRDSLFRSRYDVAFNPVSSAGSIFALIDQNEYGGSFSEGEIAAKPKKHNPLTHVTCKDEDPDPECVACTDTDLECTPCAGTGSGPYRSVIAVYDQASGLIDSQLRALYAAGQRKISITLWHRKLFDGETFPASEMACQAIIAVKNATGDAYGLPPQSRANLGNLIQAVKRTGFEQITFRFGPFIPPTWLDFWGEWNEDLYQSNWGVIKDARQVITEALSSVQGPSPRVLFDLAAEFGQRVGTNEVQEDLSKPYKTVWRYLHTLWTDYHTEYMTSGANDSVGFSIAAPCNQSRSDCGDRLTKLLELYDSVGARPAAYAFDLYAVNAKAAESGGTALEAYYQALVKDFQAIQAQLGAKGELGKEMFVQETIFNSALNRRVLDRAALEYGVPIRYIIQFPVTEWTTPIDVNDLSPADAYAGYGPQRRYLSPQAINTVLFELMK